MGFNRIIGQAFAKARILELWSQGAGHSFIITGASGSGKSLFAQEFAQYLLCQIPGAEGACGECNDCHYFLSGAHPDYKLLAPNSGEKSIKVADVRSKIGSDVRVLPQIAGRKVYVIEADGLNEEGQNALLKTLEEPPPDVFFVLTIVDAANLLPTILSRSCVIPMMPSSEKEIIEILQQQQSFTPEDALFYARYSNGIPGQAIKLAQSQWFIDLRQETMELLLKLPVVDKAYLLIDGYTFLDANKEHISEILLLIQLFLRDLMILQSLSKAETILNQDYYQESRDLIITYHITAPNLIKAQEAVAFTQRALKGNCSFESTACQLLLSLQKELFHAESNIRPVS